MSTLTDLMEEAMLDQMQLDWDTYLIDGWFNYSRSSMRLAVGNFFRKHYPHMPEEKRYASFNKLKRVPQLHHQWHTCVSRFIAGYMPILNTVLWNGKLTQDEIVKQLNASGITAQRYPEHQSARARDRKEQASSEKAANLYTSLRRIRADARDATSKSNWKVCK